MCLPDVHDGAVELAVEVWVGDGSDGLAPVPVSWRLRVRAVREHLGAEAPSFEVGLDLACLGHPTLAVVAVRRWWRWAEEVDDVAGLVVGGCSAEGLGPVGDGELGSEGVPLGVCRLGLVVVQSPAGVGEPGLSTVEVGGDLVDVGLVPG